MPGTINIVVHAVADTLRFHGSVGLEPPALAALVSHSGHLHPSPGGYLDDLIVLAVAVVLGGDTAPLCALDCPMPKSLSEQIHVIARLMLHFSAPHISAIHYMHVHVYILMLLRSIYAPSEYSYR